MKLGLAIEYAGRGVDIPIERIRRCEALGYDSVWTAEAYGSDAITRLPTSQRTRSASGSARA